MRNDPLLPLLCLACLPCLVGAQDPLKSGPKSAWEVIRDEHDANRDGSVSTAEYGRGEDRFLRLDRNGDGVLTAADFEGRSGRRGGGRGGRPQSVRPEYLIGKLLGVDADHPVAVESIPRILSALDRNRDGALVASETAKVLGVTEDQAALDLAILATAADRVTLAELAMRAKALDADRDGAVTVLEVGPALRAPSALPAVGEVAPDFTLPTKDGKSRVTLSSFAGKKPVALIFGSYT